jgi:hypothetical protein
MILSPPGSSYCIFVNNIQGKPMILYKQLDSLRINTVPMISRKLAPTLHPP